MIEESKREQLLQAAIRLFAERGYASVGVQEIVSAVGVTKPTLYHYFGSKQGLLAVILEEYAEPLLKQVRQAAVYRGDLVRSLTQVVESWFKQALAAPELNYLLMSLIYLPRGHEVHGQLRYWSAEWQSILETLFINASKQHGNLRGHHTQLALNLQGLLLHSSLYLLNQLEQDPGPSSDQLNQLVYRQVKQFMYGIYAL